MTEGPMALPSGRLEELNVLVNRIFRPDGGDMAGEYPLVFDPDHLEGMRVILEDGRIVAHVGVCIRDAALLGAPVRIASIGAVGTDPDTRGRGFAEALMYDAITRARERGSHVMLISGDRSLYRRLGACRPGLSRHVEIAEASLPSGLALDPVSEADLPRAAALYAREPVRFLRPLEDWKRLLEAGMLVNHPGDAWLVRDADRVLAYVAVQRPDGHSGGETRPRVKEYAGSREAAWHGMAALAGRHGSSSIRVSLMPDDIDMLGRASRLELPVRDDGFEATVRLLDAAALIEVIRPLWIERAGRDAVEALAMDADREGFSFRSGGERVRVDGPAATVAIFGPERGSRETAPVPPGIDPLPLPVYGYNYV